VVSHRHVRPSLSDNIVQFNDALPRFGSLPQTSPTAPYLDEARPGRPRLSLQRLARNIKRAQASELAKNIATIYKRATVAAGLESKLLSGGTMTIELVKQPDFTELDQCLRELFDLGVGPMPPAAHAANETLHGPAPAQPGDLQQRSCDP
jgi:hypothetical protein